MAKLIEHKILQDVAKPERIIIMMHGIGQHAGYMAEAGGLFSEKMPNTLILMPEGPLPIHYSAKKTAHIREKYDPGFDPTKARSWFNTATWRWPAMSLKLAFNRMPVIHQLNALADHYRDQYGLQDKDIAFFGMSQGGAMGLYSAITREKPCAAAVSHSGMFFGFARATAKPGVLMITGDDDDYLCDNKSRMKAFFLAPERGIARLQKRGIDVTEFRCPHLGHEMNAESLGKAAEYLARAFGLPVNSNEPAPLPVPAVAKL